MENRKVMMARIIFVIAIAVVLVLGIMSLGDEKSSTEKQEAEVSEEEGYLKAFADGGEFYITFAQVEAMYLAGNISQATYENVSNAFSDITESVFDDEPLTEEMMRTFNSSVDDVPDIVDKFVLQEELDRDMQGFRDSLLFYVYNDMVMQCYNAGAIPEDTFQNYLTGVEQLLTSVSHDNVTQFLKQTYEMLNQYRGETENAMTRTNM